MQSFAADLRNISRRRVPEIENRDASVAASTVQQWRLMVNNFIVTDRKLAGIIDFQGDAFSDPIFEFLLSFFVSPELQGRGIEERFCQGIGVNPAVLHWYRGLEYFDIWPWLLKTGKAFVHHTSESVEENLKKMA